MFQDADALPQPIGEYKPLDQWQAHINDLFYRLRGNELRRYYRPLRPPITGSRMRSPPIITNER